MNYLDFEVAFIGFEPRIWRRIAVGAGESFHTLHEAIQKASGGFWYDYHLWGFSNQSRQPLAVHPNDEYGIEEAGAAPADKVMLKDYFKRAGKTAFYCYDYGDDWQLQIIYKGKLDAASHRKPYLILDGQRAYPPDDCGGPWGYEECLAALGQGNTGEFNKADLKERRKWLGKWTPDALPEFDSLEKTQVTPFSDNFNLKKAAEMTLALMALGLHDEMETMDGETFARAWKGFDWDIMDYLCEQGYITSAKTKAKSVVLTPEGLDRCRELFNKHFIKKPRKPRGRRVKISK